MASSIRREAGAGVSLPLAASVPRRRKQPEAIAHGATHKRARKAPPPAYQCTPFIRFAIATCSIDAFSSGSFSPRAAAESGKTL